jgi:hypothetical protein
VGIIWEGGEKLLKGRLGGGLETSKLRRDFEMRF